MPKKKRVKNGIESLKGQIAKHRQKIEEAARELDRPWLISYWKKEISELEEEVNERERKLAKKHGK